jgi:glycosyltransferase involved in cell wall biosynthesis
MFRPEKNQRELIEIAAGWPRDFEFQLWLAGEGPARDQCAKLASAKGLADRVKFVGFAADPTPFYEAADIAVHASASESLSNFLIEAQAHGLPAVAYAAQGIGECFIPGRTGWVIPRDDRDQFRVRIAECVAAPMSVRAERACAARAFARERFDSARQVQAYLELFELLR